MDSFPYKHILVVGATAGIGRAMAERFVRGGANVTVVGRRKERLDAFVQEHGADKARSVVFDVSDIAAIPAFAEEMMKNAVPQIDCVFLNAGFQRSYDLADQGSFDLDSFRKEMDVNFTSFVASVKAFLPFLQKRDASSFILYVDSHPCGLSTYRYWQLTGSAPRPTCPLFPLLLFRHTLRLKRL